MVVKRGTNDDGILAMAEHFRGTGVILRFIEYMDVGATNGWRLDEVVPSAEIVTRDRRRAGRSSRSSRPTAARSPRATATATASGEIGLISSVTQPFCHDCTRARLSAEGKLYTCLFASRGHDLRALVRGESLRRRARRAAARALARARRPLLGAAHAGHARSTCPRSRCRTSAASAAGQRARGRARRAVPCERARGASPRRRAPRARPDAA